MIFIAVGFLSCKDINLRIWGALILLPAFLLDGLDGLLARRLCASNNIGSLIDTLGDRITENVLLIFFAYKKLIPLFIPLVFISRSFISDFIRFLAFNKGIGTFSINKSKFGFYIVASKTSRATYLILKLLVFLLGAFLIIYPSGGILNKFPLSDFLFYGVIILTAINILRFICLILDSKEILKEIFC